MKGLKRLLKWIVGLLIVIVATLYITNYEHIIKGVRVVYMTGHTTAFIDDFEYFDVETIPASSQPQAWAQHKDYNTVDATERLNQQNLELGTIAYVIIQNDSIWYEDYAPGYGRDSQTNSFSMAKSITSALLGKAIQDGYIKGLDQPVGDFFAEYQENGMTVGDLSSMSSGINWDEDYKNPFGITARAYYDDGLEETMLERGSKGPAGEGFKYLSGNTQLLGMVIEKATGKKLAAYLGERFWQPMGAQQPAIWQVDDPENRMVKSYCCVGSNALDFARFGKLYKQHGQWNGQQLLDSTFVATSVKARFAESPEYGYGFWLSDHLGKEIFVMRGILGQYVITIPEDDLIIVRLGHQRLPKADRPFGEDFYVYVEEAYKMLESKS